MKKIRVFKLSDGRIVESREEAIKQQKEIDFKKAIWEFSQRVGAYEFKDMLYNAINDNVDELRKIFNAL